MTLDRPLVIVPTYNECESLPNIVSRLFASIADVDLLVVDDGSPDGTGQLADGLARGDDRVHVLHRVSKDGLGAAYIAGFRWALERGYSVVVEMDADGSHPPERLHAMFTAARQRGAGGAIGSRWVPGGSVVDWPLSRRMISRGGSLYARLMLGLPIRDVTAGFRVYSADALRALDLDAIDSKGYCFQIDMTRRVIEAGYRLPEVPIEFRERTHGHSKMSRAIIVEAMGRVTLWGLQRAAARVRRAQSPVKRVTSEQR